MKKLSIIAALLLTTCTASAPVYAGPMADWLDQLSKDSYVVDAKIKIGDIERHAFYSGRTFGDEQACKRMLSNADGDDQWPIEQLKAKNFVEAKGGTVEFSCVSVPQARFLNNKQTSIAPEATVQLTAAGAYADKFAIVGIFEKDGKKQGVVNQAHKFDDRAACENYVLNNESFKKELEDFITMVTKEGGMPKGIACVEQKPAGTRDI